MKHDEEDEQGKQDAAKSIARCGTICKICRSEFSNKGNRMKSAVIYERNNIFFIRASSETTAGVWIDDGECYVINSDSEYEEIGKYVRIALDNSHSNIPHPTNWKSVSEPLLNAAKVKSWSTFGKTAKCVNVDMEKDIQVNSTKNKSSTKQGFVGEGSTIVTIPTNSSNVELGKTVKKKWLDCE